ncbi:hypothetical protein H8E77_42270 [bacterium]|nr:hypothetical protein [bacterium]
MNLIRTISQRRIILMALIFLTIGCSSQTQVLKTKGVERGSRSKRLPADTEKERAFYVGPSAIQ